MVSIPASLTDGDVVALVSPASAIDPMLIDGAAASLRAEGFTPRIMPHAKGSSGSFAATAAERLADLQSAIDDLDVKAIICSRGGYGAIHLLSALNLHRPVWLAGFSDISALHALWHSRGVASIHSSMAKELTLRQCTDNEANRRLFSILRTGKMPALRFEAHDLNHRGEVSGILRGGNLAVLDGLADTPYDMLLPGSILVIEDIGEAIYRVERMLMRLKLAGVLDRLNGMVIGQFTDYRPSKDWPDMYAMIASLLKDAPYPIAFNAPIGHVGGNLPFIQGIKATLRVGNSVEIS
ncbi:MAG: LD-carboxypeptidase [Bacteroides sp.]|nr:LD-carboxypeptidase [Bacteroides sp.]MCM1378934.1 LD-carboxypeptidase [Bacteroides sp.]MCM1445550.1 LD-carboxypeptidase [Prevotella sp.]